MTTPRKQHLQPPGHSDPRLGSTIPDLADRLDADELLLAIPSATSDLVREVATLCEKATSTSACCLPSTRSSAVAWPPATSATYGSRTSWEGSRCGPISTSVGALLAGRRVMITGAGGSIGSEIARQVADFEPASLILLDNDETHLHDVQTALQSASSMRVVLADVRDRHRIAEACAATRPEIVFHAAALKHVPVLETHPREAAYTNVIGTANVVDAAVATGAERCVLISSDKAINPVSVMGASKRSRRTSFGARRGPACSRASCGSATSWGAAEASSRPSCGRSRREVPSP